MRQFNLELDKTSPKTSQFTVPANEHFSILVQYKNWEDRQQWLDYTLADDTGTEELYSEAIDPKKFNREYEETDIPIDDNDIDYEDGLSGQG